MFTALGVVAAACSDLSGLTGKQQLPSGIPDPSTLKTRAGALAQYQSVLAAFEASGSISVNGGVGEPVKNSGTFVQFVIVSGLLTDELESGNLGGNQTNYTGVGQYDGLAIDTRQLVEGVDHSITDQVYVSLQGIRNSAQLTIAALRAYAPDDPPALQGQMHALAGLGDLFLSDLYCSGVPLSTLDFNADFTYHAGSTTSQVYQAASAQFDSAIVLSADSARILNLARVGKARAALALGDYTTAAAAVADVPTNFVYAFAVDWKPDLLPGGIFAGGITPQGVTVADSQGGNGLPYRSSNDPRSVSERWGLNNYRIPQYAPVAYGGAALATTEVIKPITVANGIEARLIEAEAALKAGNPAWLTILNTLRTNGTTIPVPSQTVIDTLGVTQCGGAYTTCDNAANPGTGGNTAAYGQPAAGFPGFTITAADTIVGAHTMTAPDGGNVQDYCNTHSFYIPCFAGDSLVVLTLFRPASTTYAAGTGGVNGLAPLSDPGTDAARLALLFHERGYWLYLTGHRQGDLRRLIRNYGRPTATVYPTGSYPLFGSFSRYGSDVTAPIPGSERANPLFHGCRSRGA